MDDLYFLVQEYRWMIIFVVNFIFIDFCIEKKSYIYTPKGYYWFGMITMWFIIYVMRLPVG